MIERNCESGVEVLTLRLSDRMIIIAKLQMWVAIPLMIMMGTYAVYLIDYDTLFSKIGVGVYMAAALFLLIPAICSIAFWRNTKHVATRYEVTRNSIRRMRPSGEAEEWNWENFLEIVEYRPPTLSFKGEGGVAISYGRIFWPSRTELVEVFKLAGFDLSEIKFPSPLWYRVGRPFLIRRKRESNYSRSAREKSEKP